MSAGASGGPADRPLGEWRTGPGPLAGVRVLEIALLAPDGVGMHLADLGAEVLKIEEPTRPDYVRTTGFVQVDGASVLHWHWNRGKRSVGLDLRRPEGRAVFEDLVRVSDAVIEGLRPGALSRLGLGPDRLAELNPRVVFASVSGYGSTGPYAEMPAHGVAFDAYAGLAPVADGPGDFVSVGPFTEVGTHAGVLYGALGVVAAILGARATGRGTTVEIAQADAAAGWNWSRLETARARSVGKLPPLADLPPDDPSRSGLRESVRYQYYATADGHVLVMASERAFWRNFCEGVGRPDLFERWPGREFGDHDRANRELRAELTAVFPTRTTEEWVRFGLEVDVPIAPVTYPGGPVEDPHFQARAHWASTTAGHQTLATPLRIGTGLPDPAPAPQPGQHTDDVLATVLGYDADRLAELRAAGLIG
jgi:crotonobetainyl-CoA:carnitine CoA-transferase CaiB-like acyl-CoA transferase